MNTYTKRGFQLSLITVFATVLFMGTAGVNTVLATPDEIVEGKLVIKEECINYRNVSKPFKRTIKSAFTMIIAKHLNNLNGTDNCGFNCISPYPILNNISLLVDEFFVDGTSNNFIKASDPAAAVALTKNLKQGTFKSVVWDTQNTILSLTGKIVTDKKTGVTKKIVGKIDGYTSGDSGCIYVGKFKSTLVRIQF